MKQSPKKVTMNLMVSPELKALIRQQANAQNRSMTSYLEWLVLKDVAGLEPETFDGRLD